MSNKHEATRANGSMDNAGAMKLSAKMVPAVDIYETQDELVLLADLPGVDESSLQLEVSRGVLTLEGEVPDAAEAKQHGYYRQFTLSDRIDADAGKAIMKDGVLTLRLPKSEAAKPKKIAVRTLH